MDTRQPLPNCMGCDKPQKYLWNDGDIGSFDINDAMNLANATWVRIQAGYGSNCDGNMYETVICDPCMNNLVSDSRAKFIGNMFASEQ